MNKEEIELLKLKVERTIVNNKVVKETQTLPDTIDIINKINEIIMYLNNKSYNEEIQKKGGYI